MHYAYACSFQINLLLGLLAVTEADTALSISVGGHAGRRKKKITLKFSQTCTQINHCIFHLSQAENRNQFKIHETTV